jgi:hypothetical protein
LANGFAFGGHFGVALGAFQWTVNPALGWLKQTIAAWLIDRDILWPLAENAPAWLLTHHPELRDVFSWLDGALLLFYLLLVPLCMAPALAAALALAVRCMGHWQRQRFYHLCQALLPMAACTLFLGLSGLTIQLLKAEGVPLFWVPTVRAGLLIVASAWSCYLAYGVVGYYVAGWRRWGALLAYVPAVALIDAAWYVTYVRW